MDILEGVKRLKTNLKNERDPDIIRDTRAVMAGMLNFYFNLQTDKAQERLKKHCGDCKFNIQDPDQDMRLTDSLLPELSGRTCGYCGCVLSFKIRQSIKKCDLWK